MAEAMYFGRPVVATGYSGNVDFTDSTNSCLVSYQLRPITLADLRPNPGSEHVYTPGQLWAEPNIGEAAQWMRYLWQHPAIRTRLGQRAAATIRARYSTTAVGTLLRAHVERLAAERRLALREISA
jgi:glycosyltransferase involved in cell wall biosynthesis